MGTSRWTYPAASRRVCACAGLEVSVEEPKSCPGVGLAFLLQYRAVLDEKLTAEGIDGSLQHRGQALSVFGEHRQDRPPDPDPTPKGIGPSLEPGHKEPLRRCVVSNNLCNQPRHGGYGRCAVTGYCTVYGGEIGRRENVQSNEQKPFLFKCWELTHKPVKGSPPRSGAEQEIRYEMSHDQFCSTVRGYAKCWMQEATYLDNPAGGTSSTDPHRAPPPPGWRLVVPTRRCSTRASCCTPSCLRSMMIGRAWTPWQ